MKFSIFILIAIQLVASNFAFDVETERIIDDFVENVFMRNNQIPGLGLSVVRNGTVLMSKGYGMRNITAGLFADGNTLFSIGSITKSFVGVLVVKTLNELYPELGAAILDVPIAQLIPPTVNFTLSDRYRAEHTTFRDILSHRTCLSGGAIDLIFGKLPSAAEYFYRSRFLSEVCEFRNGYAYNNNLLSLAGETIAAIAGTTLQNMTVSFARDIGMANTTYIDFDGVYESFPDMSQPYILRNGTLVQFDIFQLRKIHMGLGTGGLLSSANDMSKYMDFHLSQGRVGNRQIVPANVMSWLYTISNAFNFRGGRNEDANSIVYGDLGVAQGLFSSLYDGWSNVHHSGYWPPYHCDMRLFSATRIGVFICANGPGAILNYPTHEILAFNIFELVRSTNRSFDEIVSKNMNIGTSFVEHDLPKGHKATTVLNPSQLRNQIVLSDVVGVYGNAREGDLSIRYAPGTNNSTLQLYFSQWAHGRLQPVSGFNTSFSVQWDTTIMDHFHSYPWEAPNFWIDFGIIDSVLFRAGEWDIYDEFEFVKNATLDTFPAIPWSPNSCGPE